MSELLGTGGCLSLGHEVEDKHLLEDFEELVLVGFVEFISGGFLSEECFD